MAITLSSDYIYVIAMLKTTPLVVTIGLSLTMPLAVLGDIGMQHPVKGQVVLGAALVLVSFVVIGLEDAKRPPGVDIGAAQDEISDVEVPTGDNRP
jgi:solute carrier family 35 protein F5